MKLGSLAGTIEIKEKDQEKLNNTNKELKLLEKQYQIYNLVSQSFSSSGIPTLVILTILNQLQIETNKILTELKPGLELSFSIIKENKDKQEEDTLDIVYRLHGGILDGDLLSGGQKLAIALSLRIGLSLIIQQRLGINLQFLELDEIDQSLDEAGIQSLGEILKKLQHKFKNILIISHNKDIQELFTDKILVEYSKNNGATAKVILG